MQHQHAITYQDQLSTADLDYLVRKSNKLGRLGSEIMRVYDENDDEGKHVYFDVIGAVQHER